MKYRKIFPSEEEAWKFAEKVVEDGDLVTDYGLTSCGVLETGYSIEYMPMYSGFRVKEG